MTTVLQEPMDITNVLNNRLGTMVHHSQHFPGHYTDAHHQLSFVKPEPTMERSASPHTSEHSSYSNPHAMQRSFHSPSAMQAPMQIPSSMPTNMHVPGFPEMPNMGGMPNMTMPPHMQHHDPHQQQQQHQQQPAKAYPCSACGKRFARRSDLSRHERIHSGVRPHVCDYPDCGKMFIQRSALTVHKRVHTGEKPHTCETCAKRFGDSSSLARHRRTHTGNRPYKCPYADCQKTFTRKTTLTRHQNHHSGTIEEAAAATAAALAASKTAQRVQQTRSEGDHLSSHGSPLTTPSPAQRTMSMSPAMDLSNNMNRHTPDFQYLQQGGTLPPHLRVGSPTSTTSSAYTNGMRPTSHPTGYGPPPTLEPSLEQHQSASGSASGSPHMSSVGWQSPNQVPSPSQPHTAGYVYPDPDTYPPNAAAMGQMYYGATPQMRRPQSTEPGMVHMS